MSLLSIIQNASDQIGLPRPTSVISSSDTQIRQLVRFAGVEGDRLSRRHQWTDLVKEATFTTVATQSQGALSTIASGFRYIVNDTIWNRTEQEAIGGPLNPQDWQLLESATITGPYYDFRIRDGELLLIPTPTAGDTGAFEYVTKNWCESASGTGQSAWAADDDVGVLDEEIITQGTVWRFLRSKGVDYAEEFRDYEVMVHDAIARDGGRRVLKLDESNGDYEPTLRAPVGSWNL